MSRDVGRWRPLLTALACLTWVPVVLLIVFGPYVFSALEKVIGLTVLLAILMGSVVLLGWGWIDRALKEPTAQNAAWLLVIAGNLLLLTALNVIGDFARDQDFRLGESLRSTIVARAQADQGARREVVVDGQTAAVGALEYISLQEALTSRKGYVDISDRGPQTNVLFAFEQEGEGDYIGFLYRPDDPPLTDAEIKSPTTPPGWRLFDFGLIPKQKLAPHWYLVRYSDYI